MFEVLDFQDVIRAATSAFYFEFARVGLCQKFIAAPASDFFQLHVYRFLDLPPCLRPASVYAPGFRLGVNTGGHSAEGFPPSVGPWCGAFSPRRWGRCCRPRLCLKFFHADILHTVALFSPLAFIEAFQATDQIAGNPTDALEADSLTYVLFHYAVTSCHHAPLVPGIQVQGNMSFVASQSFPS